MSTDVFEKTNLGWQLFIFRQQLGEWVQYQFSNLQKALPEVPNDWSISSWLIQLLQLLFWLVLGLLVARIAWQVWHKFSPYAYSWIAGVENFRVAEVNTHPRESSINLLLKQAQEFSLQSNYSEACRCVYLAMLQQLHEKAIAPQQPSRTDGEYLQLLRSAASPIQPYETLITTHERLCFGSAEVLLENYQQCRQAYQEIFPG